MNGQVHSRCREVSVEPTPRSRVEPREETGSRMRASPHASLRHRWQVAPLLALAARENVSLPAPPFLHSDQTIATRSPCGPKLPPRASVCMGRLHRQHTRSLRTSPQCRRRRRLQGSTSFRSWQRRNHHLSESGQK